MNARVSANVNVNRRVALFVLDCAECGVVFGITKDYEERRRKDGVSFHCPNGHANAWNETEADRLKRELEQARSDTAWARKRMADALAEAKGTANSLRVTKGHMTRLKNRANAGVCIHCNRTFANVQRHMADKHDGWAGAKHEAQS